MAAAVRPAFAPWYSTAASSSSSGVTRSGPRPRSSESRTRMPTIWWAVRQGIALAHESPGQVGGRGPVAPRLLAHVLAPHAQRGQELREPAEIAHAVVGHSPEHVEGVVALGDGQGRRALQRGYEVTTQPSASAAAPLISAGPMTFFFCIMMLEVLQ